MGYYNHTEHIILKTHQVPPPNQNGLIYTITPCFELSPEFQDCDLFYGFRAGDFSVKHFNNCFMLLTSRNSPLYALGTIMWTQFSRVEAFVSQNLRDVSPIMNLLFFPVLCSGFLCTLNHIYHKATMKLYHADHTHFQQYCW